MTISRHFMLHGVPIATRAANRALDEATYTLLGAIATEVFGSANTSAGITVFLSYGKPASLAVPTGVREWLTADPIHLFTDGRNSYLLLDGQLLGTLSPTHRRITAWIPPVLADAPEFIGQMIVLPLLLEALRAYGFVSVHAAALAYDGYAVLFPAASGAGKTTLTLALLRAGFRLLSDDCPLLRCTDAGIATYAFAEPLHVSPGAEAFFPELHVPLHAGMLAVQNPAASGASKVALDPTSVYGECVIQQCPPRAILFPTISPEVRTRLEPLAAPEALLRLLALTMPSASRLYLRQQLNVLGDLVSATPCYTLSAGRDFERLPDSIRAVLERHDPSSKGRDM